ncbi:LamB/YcsF family protein, partial [Microbispora triticiradicis]|uniref:LamB/YcsF family protein n=1 Tax=Microbispora triticiradicis TaxID=2200763 RepID=UPI001AD6C417
LYNRACRDEEQAEAVVAAVTAFTPAVSALPILTLPGSALARVAARHGVPTVAECFADRAYTPEGTLVPRRRPGAVLHDPDEVAARAVRMAVEGVVTTVEGGDVRVGARSVCVHGDTPGSVRIARAVRRALLDAGVVVGPFA